MLGKFNSSFISGLFLLVAVKSGTLPDPYVVVAPNAQTSIPL